MSEELINEAKARIADLLEPINGGVGEDISYDEQFEEIKNETEKLSSLTGEVCNWGSVSVSSSEIMQEKSKDFRVACYLATCKLREGDLNGVLDGLLLLEGMLEKYWEDMYPPLRRIRARAGMVGWMSDQTGPVVIDYKLKAADGPLVAAIDEVSKNLDANFREKFADHYPGITKLRDAIRHLVRTVPKEAPKPEPKPEPAPAAAPPAAAAAAPAPPPPVAAPAPVAPVAEATDPTSARSAIEETATAMLRYARVLSTTKPEDVMAYRAGLFAMWVMLEQSPPATDGKTLVPPPPTYIKERLDSLVSSQDWLTLLQESLDAASDYILWLDPIRYVATAMGALGALFMKAREEVLLQTALMLKRVPMMRQLAFNEGTGFADGQTQMWIESEVLPVLASGEGGGGGAGAPSVLDEPLKEARDLAVKGELGKAIDVVSAAAAAAPTPSERFRGKLAVAQLCLGAGQHAIARSQFEGLTGQIQLHGLETWDPALCAEVYAGLYASIKALNDAKTPATEVGMAMPGQPTGDVLTPEDEAAERAAFEKLCQLDPATALKLGGKKG